MVVSLQRGALVLGAVGALALTPGCGSYAYFADVANLAANVAANAETGPAPVSPAHPHVGPVTEPGGLPAGYAPAGVPVPTYDGYAAYLAPEPAPGRTPRRRAPAAEGAAGLASPWDPRLDARRLED